jgi:hypothetical protein
MFLTDLLTVYQSFLAIFPGWLQPIVSLVIAILLVYAVIQTLRRNLIWIILLIILLPASVPVFQSLWHAIITILDFLIPG